MTSNDRIKQALDMITRFGGIDGDHHKSWVLDQIVRILCGTAEAYQAWVRNYEGDRVYDAEEDEEIPEYEWDTGIAP